MAAIMFFGLGIASENGGEYLVQFLKFVAVCVEINLVGCCFGYLCGVSFNNEEVARQIGQLGMILFHLLSGGLSNASAANAFVNIIQYVSPNRYSVQLFFMIMIYGNPLLCPDSTDQYSTSCPGYNQALAS